MSQRKGTVSCNQIAETVLADSHLKVTCVTVVKNHVIFHKLTKQSHKKGNVTAVHKKRVQYKCTVP